MRNDLKDSCISESLTYNVSQDEYNEERKEDENGSGLRPNSQHKLTNKLARSTKKKTTSLKDLYQLKLPQNGACSAEGFTLSRKKTNRISGNKCGD